MYSHYNIPLCLGSYVCADQGEVIFLDYWNVSRTCLHIFDISSKIAGQIFV